jgi:hypothetical protein
VLAAEAQAAAHRRPHGERDGHLAVAQVAEPGALGDQLVQRDSEELDEHDLDDGPHAHGGCADCGP